MGSVSTIARAQDVPGMPRGHAPPPPIVLDAPPPPELPALEYARRPFELSAEVLFGFPSCALGSSYNQRCDGLTGGPGFGATALWRPTPYFALGGTFSASSFGFRPEPASGFNQGSAGAHFWGLLTRLYFFDHGLIEPYLELGMGSGGVASRARESEAEYQEDGRGLAFRVGGALEFYLGRHVRLGPAFDWTRFNVQQLRRCGQGRCMELDRGSYGYGNGFSSVSVRLSVLVGAGL